VTDAIECHSVPDCRDGCCHGLPEAKMIMMASCYLCGRPRDAIFSDTSADASFCFADRRHCLDSRGSHFLPGARARSPRRALFRVPAALILSAWPESSRRGFNRVSYWSFISRLFRGVLSHLDFICRNGHIVGAVPGQAMGSRRRR
jgi:hypothetical protein